MSIQIPITPQELKKLKRELSIPQDFVCMDELVYIKALLVAQQLILQDRFVRATIVKGYQS